MTVLRRSAAALLVSAVATLVLTAAPAGAQERTGDDNQAVAINTEDGASVFRLAFSIRMVANGSVDQTNTAIALASCVDCQTVALAMQVVLVRGEVDTATPENLALAYNEQCAACVTYASATQIVLGFDGPVRFTSAGRQRLHDLDVTLRELEERAATLSLAELNAEIQAAKQELIAILGEELLEVDRGAADDEDAEAVEDTTTTTAEPTTSTTDDDATTTTSETTTTTTTAPEETSTTSTTEATTTTTAP